MGRHETSDESELTPLDGICPSCHANPGKECTWGVSTVRRFHKVRKAPTGVVDPVEVPELAPGLGAVGAPAVAVNVEPVLYAKHDPRRLGL